MYDVPIQNSDYLDILFSKDLEDKEKFEDLREFMYDSAMDINGRFNSFKTVISTNNYRINKAYQLQKISSLCSDFKPLSENSSYTIWNVTSAGRGEIRLQWALTRIQVIIIIKSIYITIKNE